MPEHFAELPWGMRTDMGGDEEGPRPDSVRLLVARRSSA